MQETKTFRFGFAGLLGSCVMLIVLGAAFEVLGQDSQPQKSSAKPRVSSSGRDPFKKYEPPRVILKKVGGQIIPPPIQDRIERYKAQKLAAMNARMPAPKPTTALLLNEIQVIGISRTPRGYAAIVEATPIRLSYVIYPGEPFYDGQLVAIEDNRLVFRHETVFTDGRRERSVQMKPLRQASAVTPMAAGNAVVTAPDETQKKEEEKPVVTGRP